VVIIFSGPGRVVSSLRRIFKPRRFLNGTAPMRPLKKQYKLRIKPARFGHPQVLNVILEIRAWCISVTIVLLPLQVLVPRCGLFAISGLISKDFRSFKRAWRRPIESLVNYFCDSSALGIVRVQCRFSSVPERSAALKSPTQSRISRDWVTPKSVFS
jgi:hypothetical protein